MTLEEKREFVNDWCLRGSCHGCPLSGYPCGDADVTPEETLDEMIHLVDTWDNPDGRKLLCKYKTSKDFIKAHESADEKVEPGEAVNHPSHYQGPHECIEVMEAMFGREAVKHFCMCNAFKYRFRAGMKNGEEDIRKAEFYEDYLIKMGGIDNGM